MNEVIITASGPVGSGKSALLGEIEIMLKAMGIPVRYLDEAEAQAEKNMTHADWIGELEYIKPSVVLVEKIERAAHQSKGEREE
jgi:ABC-type transport system involved in cytochrome c biogenesis ATPase subunit